MIMDCIIFAHFCCIWFFCSENTLFCYLSMYLHYQAYSRHGIKDLLNIVLPQVYFLCVPQHL